MAKPLIFALLLLSLALLFGCAQRQIPSICNGVDESRMTGCIYTSAVLEQNPNYCYSIDDTAKRAVCMRDATDPLAKKLVQRTYNSENTYDFVEPVVETGETVEVIKVSEKPAPKICDGTSGVDYDSCIGTAAIGGLNVSLCERIYDATMRKGCISEVARKTKDVASCQTLVKQSNIDLCNLYVRGDESK